MKKFLGALVCACALVFSESAVFADIQDIRAEDNQVWGAVGTSRLAFKESSPSYGQPDSEQGWMPSLAGGVSLLSSASNGFDDTVYVAFEGAIAFGNTSTSFATPSASSTSSANEAILTSDIRFGKGVTVNQAFMLIPYVELGIRHWNRNLGMGQDENYDNLDVMGGLLGQFSPSRIPWVFSLYGSGGTTFAAEVNNAQSVTSHMRNEGMFRTGGKIGYAIAPRTELFSTLDLDSFHYGHSPESFGSKTEDTAWRVGMGYHFR